MRVRGAIRSAAWSSTGGPDAEAVAHAREDDSLPLVTVIDATHASASQASVADLLAGEAGIRVRSRGGLGAFTSVSLRGAEDAEVTILLDGVPLSRAASGAIDLSQLPADGLERIEIYRGAPPIELGGEAVGGVISLISRQGTKKWTGGAEVGGGSFGARSTSAWFGGPLWSARTRLQGSLGVVPRRDRRLYLPATTTERFYAGDDKIVRRQNNDFNQLNADVTLSRRGRLPFMLAVHSYWKNQGVPGLATLGQETRAARLTTDHVFIVGEAGRRGHLVDLDIQTSLLFERNHFDNPLGEDVGPFGPSVADGEAITAGVQPKIKIALGTHQILSLVGEARLEHRQAYNLLLPTQPLLPALRGLFALAAADELSLWRDRVSIYGGLRLDLRRSALIAGDDGMRLPNQDAFDWFLSPRLNAKLRVNRLLTVRASGGRYVRFPTLLEQFGDGAFIVGQPTLKPESSWGGDFAATLRGASKYVSGGFEAAFFGRHATDLIAYIPGGNTVSPINVGDARVLGVEARGDISIAKHAEIVASYTFLDARDITLRPTQLQVNCCSRPRAARRRPALRPRSRVRFARATSSTTCRAIPRAGALNENVLPARVLHADLGLVSRGRLRLPLRGAQPRQHARGRLAHSVAARAQARPRPTRSSTSLTSSASWPSAYYATARFTR